MSYETKAFNGADEWCYHLQHAASAMDPKPASRTTFVAKIHMEVPVNFMGNICKHLSGLTILSDDDLVFK